MCSRRVTLSRRCCRRRVTVAMRNSSQLREDLLQAHHLRPPVEADDVQVHAVVALEVGGREQVIHHLDHVDAVRARHDHEARRVLVVRLVADVLDHRELLVADLLRDLLLDLAARHLVRKLRDDGVAVFDLVGGARLEAADALVVELHEVGARRDDLGAGGKVRPLHELHQLLRGGFRLFEQMDARRSRLRAGCAAECPSPCRPRCPDVPFSSTFGRRAGRIAGSSIVPSKLGSSRRCRGRARPAALPRTCVSFDSV